MQKIKFIFIIFLVFVFSCEKQSTDLGTNLKPIGKMALQIDMTQAPAEVVKIIGILSRDGYEDIIFHFDIEGESATALVEDLAQGVWKLRVDAYNNTDIIIYTGSTDVYIASGVVTPVHLQLNPATGSIFITVDWGDSGREWGEPAYGIRISINLDDQELKPYDKAYSNILVENVSGDSIFYEAYVSFCLYDSSSILRYMAFFDLMGTDSSDYFHPKSLISFNEGNLIDRTIEITGLPWVSPESSGPPQTDFYHLIQFGQYNLQLQIEPILLIPSIYPKIPVSSNKVKVNIKSINNQSNTGIEGQIYANAGPGFYIYTGVATVVVLENDSTTKVTEVKSDSTGYFKIDLSPGKYLLYVKESHDIYYSGPYEVMEGNYTESKAYLYDARIL